MPYVAFDDLKALIPMGWLVESLDDDADGTQESFDAVRAAAEDGINSVLSTSYTTPISTPEQYPFLKHVARYEVARLCYFRRGYSDAGFPHLTTWDLAWKQLTKIGAGSIPLGPQTGGGNDQRPAPRGAIITGPSRTHSKSGAFTA